MVYRSALVGV